MVVPREASSIPPNENQRKIAAPIQAAIRPSANG
jgi:hypothetical protein